MAKGIKISDSSSGVSDQQSVGSSPGSDTCIIKEATLSLLRCLSDGT